MVFRFYTLEQEIEKENSWTLYKKRSVIFFVHHIENLISYAECHVMIIIQNANSPKSVTLTGCKKWR